MSTQRIHDLLRFGSLCLGAALILLGSALPAAAQGVGYWHASGSQILDANNAPVRIAGVNWYGFETTDAVVHGLYSQDYKSILNTIKNQGYNTVRIPFSNQMAESNPVPSNINFGNGRNSDLNGLHSLDILDKIIVYSGQIGLRIILDNHRSAAGNSADESGLWYTAAYPESNWIQDWVNLANRYKGNSTVIGFDLRNEPHNSASWGSGDTATDWRMAAQRAGNQVLGVNPNLLIFVEGIQAYNHDYYWWGGNLEGAGPFPVTLNVANRVVYSAHDYGPVEYAQNWFNGSTTYISLAAVWTKYWAYLSINNIAPVWVGEFGTTNTNTDIQNNAAGSQGQWFQSMIQFLHSHPALSWTYWALNGEDRYGLLDGSYDPTPANALKQQTLSTIQFPLGGGTGGSPDFAVSFSPSSQTVAAGGSAGISVNVTAQNGFASSVGLSVSGLPPGVTGSFNPASVTGPGTSTLTVATSASTPAGTYKITITASAGSLQHTASSTLTITSSTPDFSLTATPASQSAPAGAATTFTTQISARNGFGGSVSMQVSGLPSGGTAQFNPAVINGSGSSSLTVATSSTTPSGTYPLTVSGTSGNLTHSAAVSLTVTPPVTTAGCSVQYAVSNDWGSGFVTNLTIINQSTVAVNSWTLAWKFSGNQQITNLWNGALTQSGQSVTVRNMSYNGTIAANGGSTQLGFQAAYSGTNVKPTAISLNGVACTVQ